MNYDDKIKNAVVAMDKILELFEDYPSLLLSILPLLEGLWRIDNCKSLKNTITKFGVVNSVRVKQKYWQILF